MKKLFSLCIMLMVACVASTAHADGLALDKVILNFQPGDKPVDSIKVTNKSDRTLKVSVESVEVTHSGLPDQVETPTNQLIVAPKAFELAAGETRPIRLILRGYPEDMESVYRIRFKPDAPTVEKRQDIEGKEVKVNVIITMGALIMVEPKNPAPNLTFTRTGSTISFVNKGNVTATLQREDFCQNGRASCTPLKGMRIFPGAAWDMDVPPELADMPFTQTVRISGKYSTLSYPAP